MNARLEITHSDRFPSRTVAAAVSDSIRSVIMETGTASECLQVAADFKNEGRWCWTFKGVKSDEQFEAAVVKALREWGISSSACNLQFPPTPEETK